MFQDPVRLFNELPCEAGRFSCNLNPYRFFQSKVWRLYFPRYGTLGWEVCLAPQLFLPLYLHTNVGPPAPPAGVWPPQSSSHHLSTSPLHPGCPFPPFLLFWMNVSSFSPWLSDFQTIRFSGCCGYFLFLNLLFFFWLFEEVMFIPTLPSWPEVRKIDILKFMNGNVNVWVYIEFVSFPSLLIFGHFILFLECMVIFPWLEDTAITNYKANLKLWVITFSCRDDLLFLWSCSQTGSKLHKPSLWLMSAKLKLGSVFMRSWLWSR